MIVVDLICSADHRFEAWFASHESLTAQQAQGLVVCPMCGTRDINRIPSAPHVARSNLAPASATKAKEPVPESVQADSALANLIANLRDQIGQSENVGKEFATEARKIHHGEAEERAIRGTATIQEAVELIEEGINILPVPPSKEDLH